MLKNCGAKDRSTKFAGFRHMAHPDHIVFLQNKDSIRQRNAPRRGDYYYLHLSDLLLALQEQASEDEMDLLDFGAGGSPYKLLFPNARYVTADVDGASADYAIDSQNRIGIPAKSFDVVLSTQVLEHCKEPRSYLDEARRLLRPNGKMILTTHGLFEEHGCPYDYWRWTRGGLRSLVEESGFVVERLQRLTIGPRAAFHLLQSALGVSRIDPKNLRSAFVLRLVFRLLFARRFWDKMLDFNFPECRVVEEGSLEEQNTYVGLLIVGRIAFDL